VRLPDLQHMQVRALVEEDKIALLAPDMPVTVRLQAFPDAMLTGRVVKIHQYPEPDDWLSTSVQRYRTIVAIDTPPPGTRPGMTAELAISVQRLKDRLQVPCTAVLRHGERDYCILYDGRRYEAREVALGPNNGTSYVVREGLQEGEQLVLGAAAHRDKVELPELDKQPFGSRSLATGAQAVHREGLNN